MKHKASILFALVSVLLLMMVALAGCQRADVEQAAAVDETEPKGASATTDAEGVGTTAPEERGAGSQAGYGGAVAESGEARAGNGVAQAGDAVAGDGKARAGDVVAGDGEAGEEKGAADAHPSEVRLKVDGEPGTRFSGICAVGGEEREVSGQVPERFVYEPEVREVECEIRKEEPDDGPLEFSIIADGGNQKQRIQATGDTMSFAYSGDSISYTTSSASGAAVQRSTITSSSSSSVSSLSTASSSNSR